MHNSKGCNFSLLLDCGLVRTVLCLAALLTLMGCAAREGRIFPRQTGELSVSIEGFRNNNGDAVISLFATEKGFPDDMERAWQNQQVKIVSGHAYVLFKDVPYGEYALSILHDEDGDNHMNSGWLGKPLEGFGFSGRPEYKFGPPDFADAAFLLVSEIREITVLMRYGTEREKMQVERRTSRSSNP